MRYQLNHIKEENHVKIYLLISVWFPQGMSPRNKPRCWCPPHLQLLLFDGLASQQRCRTEVHQEQLEQWNPEEYSGEPEHDLVAWGCSAVFRKVGGHDLLAWNHPWHHSSGTIHFLGEPWQGWWYDTDAYHPQVHLGVLGQEWSHCHGSATWNRNLSGLLLGFCWISQLRGGNLKPTSSTET